MILSFESICFIIFQFHLIDLTWIFNVFNKKWVNRFVFLGPKGNTESKTKLKVSLSQQYESACPSSFLVCFFYCSYDVQCTKYKALMLIGNKGWLMDSKGKPIVVVWFGFQDKDTTKYCSIIAIRSKMSNVDPMY